MQHLADEIKTGQQPDSNTVSLLEKKQYYQEVFGNMRETITQVKDRLKAMQRKTPNNNRIAMLLERYEKCEEEIHRIGEMIGGF